MNTSITESLKEYIATPIKQGYKLQAVHRYLSADGNEMSIKVRLKHPETKQKWIRPFHKLQNAYVCGEPRGQAKKYLYELPRLIADPESPVIVVEGELCVDKLLSKGVLATTSGSADSAGQADWTPLRGREIIIWPDNDDAGQKYAENVAAILTTLSCSVKYIDISSLNLPPKGDFIDWWRINGSVSKQDILALPLITPDAGASGRVVLSCGSTEWFIPVPLVGAQEESKPYPVSQLPVLIRDAVEEYQDYGQQPVPLIVASALANLSLASQGIADVARDSKLVGPASLYFVVIADSGERKTAADIEFSMTLRNWNEQRQIEAREKVTEYQAAISVWDAEREGIKARIKNLSGKKRESGSNELDLSELKNRLYELERSKPARIMVPNLFHEVITSQKLVQSLAEGWPSSSLWSDEGGLIVGSHGMNDENMLSFLALLNRLWDGRNYSNETKSCGSFVIRGRRFTLNLMLQQIVLKTLLNANDGQSRGTGFLARTFIAWPQSTMGNRFYKPPTGELPAVQRYLTRLQELVSIPLEMDCIGALQPAVLQLDEDAKGLWVEYFNATEKELRPIGEYVNVKDFASKSADNAARLAGLFHTFQSGVSGRISGAAMLSAIEIAHWYLGEARRIISALQIPTDRACAEELLLWFCRVGKPELPARDILQYGPAPLRTAKKRDQILHLLEEFGYLRVTTGRRSMIILNPIWLDSKGVGCYAATQSQHV